MINQGMMTFQFLQAVTGIVAIVYKAPDPYVIIYSTQEEKRFFDSVFKADGLFWCDADWWCHGNA